ncbi:MAG: hypothetical protein ACPGGA_07245 [Balneolaceae bacterium]
MIKRSYIFIALLFITCTSNNSVTEFDDQVLATVGEEVITSEEFILNYEFGFNQNKTGEDQIRDYLYLMIDELIIAQNGYELKIDTTQHIKDAISSMMEERVIEEVFNQEVLNKIEVSEEEIRQEINKAAVSFQLKFMPSMSESHASFLKQEIDQKGYDEVLTEYSNEMMAERPNAGDFTTPFMTSDQINPQLMDIVSDLELQTISEPVLYNNQWMLVMVENIRRTPIAPEDYDQQRETYRKVVYNRKALQGAEVFIAQMMEPLDVSTKRAPFQVLSNAFFEWFDIETPTGDLVKKVENGTETYHQEIEDIFDETLVTWASQEWSVRDFLSHFSPGRYQLRTYEAADFKVVFADVIALVVRDYQLLELASTNQYSESHEVLRDVQLWEQKWVFQETRKAFFDDLEFNDSVVQEFYLGNPSLFHFNANGVIDFVKLSDSMKRQVRSKYLTYHLKEHANTLRESFPVSINEKLLAELEVQLKTNASSIQTQLLKQNSNRMAFPVVDPNW